MGRALLVAVVVALFAPAAAVAQEAAPFSFNAQAGIAGYVAADRPTVVTVDISAELLLVGNLRVGLGGARFDVPIEVPAGGTKRYAVDLPAPGSSRQVALSLIPDGDADAAVNARVALRTATDTLVGILGSTELPALAQARTTPLQEAVVQLEAVPTDIGPALAPLAYLVATAGDPELDTDALTSLTRWVEQGGRLVAQDSFADSFAAAPVGSLAPGALVGRLGKGEIITVDDPAGLSQTAWSAILRDVPGPLEQQQGFGFAQPEFMLVDAAGSGSSPVPGLPWLLGALAVYVLIVGPVNFFVLRRRSKAELAWLTVPLIALVAVAGFWLMGRQQLETRIARHATVMVQEKTSVRATSAMAIVAGRAGSHDVALPSGWYGYPIDTTNWFGQVASNMPTVLVSESAGAVMSFDLENLEAGALRADWSPPRISLEVEAVVNGRSLEATIQNTSGLEFWSWGVGWSGTARGGREPLAAGDTATLTVNRQAFREPFSQPLFEAVASMQRFDGGFNGPNRNVDRLWSLADAAGRVASDVVGGSSAYFFGVTDQLEPSIVVDGSATTVGGVTFVIIELDLSAAGVTEGETTPELLKVEGPAFVEGEPGFEVFIVNADAVVMQYVLPQAVAGPLSIGDNARQFGNPPTGAEVYDWVAGEFVSVGWPASFDSPRHVSVAGEVVVRVVFSKENQDFGTEVFPSAYPLEWSAA